MLKLSKKVEYAVISMVHMADRTADTLFTSREISRHYNIPQELIGKVLQRLARYGLIASVQGVKGGYRLALPATDINLSQVIVAIDGPIQVVGCLDDPDNCTCEQKGYCNVRNPMLQIQQLLTDLFEAITLRDLKNNSILETVRPYLITADSISRRSLKLSKNTERSYE